MTCQDIVHNLYNFYIDNKYHRFLRDNCHEYCTIVGFYLQLFNNTNHECGTELVILKRFLKDKHSYDIILIFDWTIECIMQITYSLVDLVSIILVFEFDTLYRDVQKVGYIFHIKPHFVKTLFQSQLMFDFDEIFTNQSVNVCIFCIVLKYCLTHRF